MTSESVGIMAFFVIKPIVISLICYISFANSNHKIKSGITAIVVSSILAIESIICGALMSWFFFHGGIGQEAHLSKSWEIALFLYAIPAIIVIRGLITNRLTR